MNKSKESIRRSAQYKLSFSSSPRLNRAASITKRRIIIARVAIDRANKDKKNPQPIDLRSVWTAPPSLAHPNRQINDVAIATMQCMAITRNLAVLANNPACNRNFRRELFTDMHRINIKADALLKTFTDNVKQYEQHEAQNNSGDVNDDIETADLEELRHSRNHARLK